MTFGLWAPEQMGFAGSFFRAARETSFIKLPSWGLAGLGARVIAGLSHLGRLTIVEFVAFPHQVRFHFS